MARMAQTLSQMKREHQESIERGRGFSVAPELLQEQEDFNVRDYDDPSTEEHIENLKNAYKSGQWVQPLVVQTIDNNIYIRDGHCRFRALTRAKAEGADIRRVEVVEHSGDELDQMALILTSNAGKTLNALERAKVYLRMKRHGLKEEEIGERLGRTGQHVRQMLALMDLPTELKAQIKSGMVSPTTALEMYADEGTKAAAKIAKAHQEQADKGGKPKKVTRKHLTKQRRLPPAVMASLRGTLSHLAPMLADLEVNENDDQVSLTLDRETFLKLRQDALKVRESDLKQQEDEKKASEQADGDAEAEPGKKGGKTTEAATTDAESTPEAPAEAATTLTTAGPIISAHLQDGDPLAETPDEAAATRVPQETAAQPEPEATAQPQEDVAVQPDQEAPVQPEEEAFAQPGAEAFDDPIESREAQEAVAREAVESDEGTQAMAADDDASLHTEAQDNSNDTMGMLDELSTMTQDDDDFEDDFKIIREEDEEHVGMHNLPEGY